MFTELLVKNDDTNIIFYNNFGPVGNNCLSVARSYKKLIAECREQAVTITEIQTSH